MFISPKGFKSLIKDAYKRLGLTVENVDGVYIVHSTYFRIECKEEFMSNKAKAALIEITGELPAEGTAKKFMKDTQVEEQELTGPFLIENHSRMNRECMPSKLYIRQFTGVYNVMQETDGTKLMVNQIFPAMVKEKPDVENGETFPGYGRCDDVKVIWANNVCAIQCNRIRPRFAYEAEIFEKIGLSDILNDKEECDE